MCYIIENYRTKAEYDNALIVRRCLFQFFNNFIALFWCAFVQQDIEKLRYTLGSLMVTFTIVNDVQEIRTQCLFFRNFVFMAY